MIASGIILLVPGFIFPISILWTIGIILVLIGVILWLSSAMGREVGVRRHFY